MGGPPATRPAVSDPGSGRPSRAVDRPVCSARYSSIPSSWAVPPKSVSSHAVPESTRGRRGSSDVRVRTISRPMRSSTAAVSGNPSGVPGPNQRSSIFARSASSASRPRSFARASVRAHPPTGIVRVAAARPSSSRQKVDLRWPRSTSSRTPSRANTETRFASTRPSASRMWGSQSDARSDPSRSETSRRRAMAAMTSLRERSPPTTFQSTTNSSSSKGRSAATSKGTAWASLRRSRNGNSSRRAEIRSLGIAETTFSTLRPWVRTRPSASSDREISGSPRLSEWSETASIPRRVWRSSTALRLWLPRSRPKTFFRKGMALHRSTNEPR